MEKKETNSFYIRIPHSNKPFFDDEVKNHALFKMICCSKDSKFMILKGFFLTKRKQKSILKAYESKGTIRFPDAKPKEKIFRRTIKTCCIIIQRERNAIKILKESEFWKNYAQEKPISEYMNGDQIEIKIRLKKV